MQVKFTANPISPTQPHFPSLRQGGERKALRVVQGRESRRLNRRLPIMNTAPRKAEEVISLKVTLRGIRPPIWRRLEVPSRISLGILHDAIQAAMGWGPSPVCVRRRRTQLWRPCQG